MLILTRRAGESIVIGENTIFTIIGIKGNQVRLGINAPSDILVYREELLNKIKASKSSEKTVTLISKKSKKSLQREKKS